MLNFLSNEWWSGYSHKDFCHWDARCQNSIQKIATMLPFTWQKPGIHCSIELEHIAAADTTE